MASFCQDEQTESGKLLCLQRTKDLRLYKICDLMSLVIDSLSLPNPMIRVELQFLLLVPPQLQLHRKLHR